MRHLDACRLRDRSDIAEIASDRGHWLVAQVVPGDEGIAASHLAGRGFGIFIPGFYVNGRWACFLPGYVFVNVFGIEHHRTRILGCPGVVDLIYEIGHPSCPYVVPDKFIDVLRNSERSSIEGHEDRMMAVAIGKPRRPRKRWRKSLRIRKRKNIGTIAASA